MSAGWPSAEAVVDQVGRLGGTALLHGTLLVGVTALLAGTLLRRARPALLAAMWTVVLLKFLVPVGPAVPFSLSALVARLAGTPASAPVELAEVPAAALTAVAPAPAAPAVGSASTYLWLAALALHGLIALTLVVRRVRRYRTARRATADLPLAGERIHALVARCAYRVGLGLPPVTRMAPAASPFVLGLHRPVLVVPAWLVDRPAELEAVVLHELAHIRRRDAWVRLIQVAAATLFWFWPVVAWVNRRIDHARELACDQWAVRLGPLSARRYAGCLVGVLRRARELGEAAPPVLAMLPRRSQLEQRIEQLLREAPRPRLGLSLTFALAAWGLVSLGGSAAAVASDLPAEARICVIDPSIVQRILESNPESDLDGDGALSEAEVCAHQVRMRTKLLDGLAENLSAGDVQTLYPGADADGDGRLSSGEREALRTRLVLRVEAEQQLVVQYGTEQLQSTEVPVNAELLDMGVVDTCAIECAPDACLAHAEPSEAVVLINVDFDSRDSR